MRRQLDRLIVFVLGPVTEWLVHQHYAALMRLDPPTPESEAAVERVFQAVKARQRGHHNN